MKTKLILFSILLLRYLWYSHIYGCYFFQLIIYIMVVLGILILFMIIISFTVIMLLWCTTDIFIIIVIQELWSGNY
jgi:hypothetical protein